MALDVGGSQRKEATVAACRAGWFIALAAVSIVLGCHAATDSPVASEPQQPDAVVSQFLEAVRTGDDKRAAALLTTRARTRTAEMEIVVAPPGSDTAKFKVHDVTVAMEGAQVRTEWTDLDTDGRLHTDEIVWILRKEADAGWRIKGMITKVFADRDSITLNFEEPEEMLQRQQQAEDELARRQHDAESSDSSIDRASDARR
jgi:hypothetical protein